MGKNKFNSSPKQELTYKNCCDKLVSKNYRFETFEELKKYNNYLKQQNKMVVAHVTITKDVVDGLVIINDLFNRMLNKNQLAQLKGMMREKLFKWNMPLIEVGFIEVEGKQPFVLMDAGHRMNATKSYMKEHDQQEVSFLFRFNSDPEFDAHHDQHKKRDVYAQVQKACYLQREANQQKSNFHQRFPRDTYGELSHCIANALQNGFCGNSRNQALKTLGKELHFKGVANDTKFKTESWINTLTKVDNEAVEAIFDTFDVRKKVFGNNTGSIADVWLTCNKNNEKRYLKNALCQVYWHEAYLKRIGMPNNLLEAKRFVDLICSATEEEIREEGTIENVLYQFLNSFSMFTHIVEKCFISKGRTPKNFPNTVGFAIKEKFFFDAIRNYFQGNKTEVTSFKDIYFNIDNITHIVGLLDYESMEKPTMIELGVEFREFKADRETLCDLLDT